jgi:hypothetical protein
MWIPTILAKVENESIVKYKISKRKKEKIYLYKDGCLMLLQMVDDGATSENVYKIDKDLYQPENKQIVIDEKINRKKCQIYKDDKLVSLEKEQFKWAEEQLNNYSVVIKKLIQEKIEEKEEDYLDEVRKMVVSIIVYGEKYDIDYSNDPNWDHSGETYATGKRFNPDDYDKLGYLLDEYNGEKEPSFMSGCGFFHNCYKKEFEELTREFIWSVVGEVVKSVYLDDNRFRECSHIIARSDIGCLGEDEEVIDDMVRYLSQIRELDDYIVWEVDYELQDLVRDMPVKKLYEEGSEWFLDESDKEYLEMEKKCTQLLDKIKSMDGIKMITVVTDSFPQVFELEDDELTSPFIVNGRGHYSQLRNLIKTGMKTGGGMTIRQITPLKIADEGELFHISKISGVRLMHNSWEGISSVEMEEAHCTDAETGKRLPKEKYVSFTSFQ